MAEFKLTYELCMAAGKDAGNKHMRKGNRTAWNRSDYNIAAKESGRLLDILDIALYTFRQRY